MTVVVVAHPSLPFALQQERQAVALCLHSDRARMSIWRTRLRHERPERPGVQSPRADVRSARACVRQSSFCEAQDVLHSRQALSHVFLAASMCEALTSRRTGASSVRRGPIRGTAPKARGPCLRASMVGCPSGYGGFPYQRNTFCGLCTDPGHRPQKVLRWYGRSEEHTSELQSRGHLGCRPLLEKQK